MTSSTDLTDTADGKIDRLQNALLQFTQWDGAEKNTTHHFADHMYCRMLFRPAGTLILGKRHKKEHFYLVMQGAVRVAGGPDGPVDYRAPALIVSKPGTRRAVLALEDSVCATVHRTDKTDLAEIEAELIEEDPTALFDAHNRVKPLELK